MMAGKQSENLILVDELPPELQRRQEEQIKRSGVATLVSGMVSTRRDGDVIPPDLLSRNLVIPRRDDQADMAAPR